MKNLITFGALTFVVLFGSFVATIVTAIFALIPFMGVDYNGFGSLFGFWAIVIVIEAIVIYIAGKIRKAVDPYEEQEAFMFFFKIAASVIVVATISAIHDGISLSFLALVVYTIWAMVQTGKNTEKNGLRTKKLNLKMLCTNYLCKAFCFYLSN